jgi:hypothetical protein
LGDTCPVKDGSRTRLQCRTNLIVSLVAGGES